MGQTVNLLVYTFGGSNPSSPTKLAEVAQLIEHQPSKLRVASLSLVFRSNAQQRVIRTPLFSDDGEFVSLACSAK